MDLLATGSSSPDGTALNTEKVTTWVQDNMHLVIDYSVKTVGVLVILLAAWILSGWISRSITKGMTRAKLDLTLARFAGKAAKWGILIFTILGCLGFFGVDVTSFAAAIAAVGFAIGMALQGSLSHLAAGVMLLVFRPFKVGDAVVVAGQTGKIFEIDLFSTSMDTFDNRRIIIPNGKIFGSVIENVSHHSTRRVDVAVGTQYTADLDHTRAVLKEAAESVELRLPDTDVNVVLLELANSSISWSVRVWAPTTEYAVVKDELTKLVKNRLDEASVGIPFPQMDVHLMQTQ